MKYIDRHIPIDMTHAMESGEYFCDIWERVYRTAHKMGVLVFKDIKSAGHVHRINFVEVG